MNVLHHPTSNMNGVCNDVKQIIGSYVNKSLRMIVHDEYYEKTVGLCNVLNCDSYGTFMNYATIRKCIKCKVWIISVRIDNHTCYGCYLNANDWVGY